MQPDSRSEEEKTVAAIVDDAIRQKESKETAFNNVPPDKGPQPAFDGSGLVNSRQPGQQQARQATLKGNIDNIREGTLNKTAEAIKGAPAGTQAKAYRIADEYAYLETARQNDPQLKKGQAKDLDEAQRSAMHQLGHTDMKARHERGKEISESQDYAMRRLGDEKEKNKGSAPQKKSEPFKGAGMSKSFSASLGYSKLNKPLDNSLESKEAKQPMAMSGKFSTTLSYNNMRKGDKSTSQAREIKSNGKDITKD